MLSVQDMWHHWLGFQNTFGMICWYACCFGISGGYEAGLFLEERGNRPFEGKIYNRLRKCWFDTCAVQWLH